MAKSKFLPIPRPQTPGRTSFFQQGHAGVDRLLKQFADVKIQPAWEILAMRLLLDINSKWMPRSTPQKFRSG